MSVNFNEDAATVRANLFGILTDEEVALLLNVSVYTLRDWRHLKTGPDYTRVGKAVFYEIDAIKRWLAVNTVSSGGVAA